MNFKKQSLLTLLIIICTHYFFAQNGIQSTPMSQTIFYNIENELNLMYTDVNPDSIKLESPECEIKKILYL